MPLVEVGLLTSKPINIRWGHKDGKDGAFQGENGSYQEMLVPGERPHNGANRHRCKREVLDSSNRIKQIRSPLWHAFKEFEPDLPPETHPHPDGKPNILWGSVVN
jgi:hypothetical protein